MMTNPFSTLSLHNRWCEWNWPEISHFTSSHFHKKQFKKLIDEVFGHWSLRDFHFSLFLLTIFNKNSLRKDVVRLKRGPSTKKFYSTKFDLFFSNYVIQSSNCSFYLFFILNANCVLRLFMYLKINKMALFQNINRWQ